MKLNRVVSIVSIGLISTSAQARTSIDRAVQAEVTEKVSAMMKTDQIPGLAFSIVSLDDSGHIATFAKGLGLAEVNRNGSVGALVTPDTLFRVASISKTLTARTLLRILALGCLRTAAGKPANLMTRVLDLDSKFARRLRRHAQDGRLRQAEYWQVITMDDILRHQSGLEIEPVGRDRWADYDLLGATDREMSDTEFDAQIDQMGFAYPPNAIPVDAGIKYSNLGFNLLGRIIGEACPIQVGESATASFQARVKSEVLNHFNMNDTLYNLPRTAAGRARHSRGFSPIRPYYDSPRPGEIWYQNRIQSPHIFEPESYSASSGLATSANDIAKYVAAYLLNIKGLGGDVISRADLMSLIEPNVADNVKRVWARGHLWFDSSSANMPIGFGHTGTDTSHRTVFLVFPQYGLGAAVLINAQNAERETYVYAILNILLKNGYGSDYTAPADVPGLLNRVHGLALAYQPKPAAPILPASDIPDFVRPLIGVFKSRLIDDLTLVYTQNETLAIDLGSGRYEELTKQPNPDSRCLYDRDVYVLPTSDFYHGDKLRFECDSYGYVRRAIEANGSYFNRD